MIGSKENKTRQLVDSCSTSTEMITVNRGAELLISSANETGMYQSAIKDETTVKNLKSKQICKLIRKHFPTCPTLESQSQKI